MFKNFITLQGHGQNTTRVVWNDTASVATSTYRSASIAIDAQYFAAMNITFQVIHYICFLMLVRHLLNNIILIVQPLNSIE